MKLLFENWRKYLTEQEEGTEPRLIFLIGPPSVGKSTWTKEKMQGDFLVINRDDIVEKIALESGVGTYDDTYKKPPAEILPTPLPEPKDQQAVEQYLASLKAVADKFNSKNPEQTKQFGPVEPFTAEKYIKALTPRTEGGWGISMLDEEGKQNFIPLYYPKIESALEKIKKQFEETRVSHARDTKDVVIDMLNMSVDERDGHRVEMAKAIATTPVDSVEEARQIIKHKFKQEAYVFANSLEGWSDEEKKRIMLSAKKRAKEIEDESAGKRSKTIPPGKFGFDRYAPPTTEEGFVTRKPVGMPALGRLQGERK